MVLFLTGKELIMDIYFISIFCIVFGFILIVPFVVGVFFISDKNNNSNRLRKLTGWFIFKPIITTPIWIFVILYSNYLFISQPSIFWSLISIAPAIITTIIIVYKFRDLFYLKNFVAWILLDGGVFLWQLTFLLPVQLKRDNLFDKWNISNYVYNSRRNVCFLCKDF